MEKPRVLIIDFEDSFTFNIARECFNYSSEVKVVFYREFFHPLSYHQTLSTLSERDILILGPGPKHPRDYPETFLFIADLLTQDKWQVFGICLGHQLMAYVLGHQVIRSKEVMHAEAVKLKSNFFGNINVYRYNSLEVLAKNCSYEKAILYGDRVYEIEYGRHLSVQYHPESIGSPAKNIFKKFFKR